MAKGGLGQRIQSPGPEAGPQSRDGSQKARGLAPDRVELKAQTQVANRQMRTTPTRADRTDELLGEAI